MKLPIQITYRGCQESEAITNSIQKHAEHLDRFCSDIMRCDVLIDVPHRHQAKGVLYHVRIDLTVSGKEIVVCRDPSKNKAHKDLYVAIRDAFDAARRQLEDFSRVRRHDVKTHTAFRNVSLSTPSQAIPEYRDEQWR